MFAKELAYLRIRKFCLNITEKKFYCKGLWLIARKKSYTDIGHMKQCRIFVFLRIVHVIQPFVRNSTPRAFELIMFYATNPWIPIVRGGRL